MPQEIFYKTCAAAVTIGVALAPSNALAVTTWNWSFTTDIADQFGSGTFTTADVVPTAGTTYQITGVSGTYNRGGTAYTITGPRTSWTNQFRWDGTTSSQILSDRTELLFSEGLTFNLTGRNYITLIQSGAGFKETLENLVILRENGPVIAAVDWLHGHQAVRFR